MNCAPPLDSLAISNRKKHTSYAGWLPPHHSLASSNRKIHTSSAGWLAMLRFAPKTMLRYAPKRMLRSALLHYVKRKRDNINFCTLCYNLSKLYDLLAKFRSRAPLESSFVTF